MARKNIVLEDELFDAITVEARKEGVTRSALVRAALKQFVELRRRRREEEEKRRQMRDAARKIDELAKKLGKWEAQLTIRKFRDHILGVTGPRLKGSSGLYLHQSEG